jgi:Resolvase, N terminal domain
MVDRKLQSRAIDDQMQLDCSRTWTALNRQSGKIDTVVVYKVDRLTRSLADFAKLVELFDQQGVSFVTLRQARPLRDKTCQTGPSSGSGTGTSNPLRVTETKQYRPTR